MSMKTICFPVYIETALWRKWFADQLRPETIRAGGW